MHSISASALMSKCCEITLQDKENLHIFSINILCERKTEALLEFDLTLRSAIILVVKI